jgi:DNA-binding transcriptional LysR family regulator
MQRPVNLRQIEAFKAIVEAGTVSRAADMLGISQPAASKLLAHLEADSGLRLFDRVRGRLAPTARGMRLYEEVDRIFAGLGQVERSIDQIRREDRGQIVVGVMPALAGDFIQRATTRFLKSRPNVFVSIRARSSQFIADWLVTRQIDIGLISSPIENPYVAAESLMRLPLVCIAPLGHKLAARDSVRIADLADVPQVGFETSSQTRRRIDALFERHRLRPHVVLEATTAPTLCEFVAAGVGVALVHPAMAQSVRGRVAIRRFRPAVPFDFLLCRSREGRNSDLVDAFAHETRALAAELSAGLLSADAAT